MDRNNKWTELKSIRFTSINRGSTCGSYSQCLINSYSKNISDEFIEPTLLVKESNIRKNDVVIFLNFRPDRALQLSQVIFDAKFDKFERVNIYPIFFASMVEYRKDSLKKSIPKQYINLPG